MAAARGRRCALRLVLAGALGFAWYGISQFGDDGAAEAETFVNPTAATTALRSSRVRAAAEAAGAAGAAPPKAAERGSSSALVKIDEENVKTTSSVLGGLAGLYVGGIWGSALVFLLASYVARNLDKKDGDENLKTVSEGLQGVSQVSLEALNAAGYVNDKYELTSKASGVLGGLVDKLKENPQASEVVKQIEDLAKGAGQAVTDLDNEVGLKDTAGSIFTSLSELAELGIGKVTDKAQELNKEYKISDQVMDKINSAQKP